MTLRRELQDDLTRAGLPPLHRFGQHFMVDDAALACLLEALGPLEGARVVEIGPGTGLLTRRLLAAGAQVLAVELDRGWAARLAEGPAEPHLQVVQGDCLASKARLHPAIEAFAQEPWRLGANLPYEVSLPVILNACALPQPPAVIAVTVQFEAAQRLVSQPGDPGWGASAATLQAAGEARILRRLGPGSFYPPPRVESAIVRWQPARTLPPGFGAWCRRLFSARRKVLPGALRDAGLPRPIAEDCCHRAALDTARRVESLSPSELVALHAACLATSGTASPPWESES